jgi:hypothetical protein
MLFLTNQKDDQMRDKTVQREFPGPVPKLSKRNVLLCYESALTNIYNMGALPLSSRVLYVG